MKQITKYAAVAIATLLLAACGQKESLPAVEERPAVQESFTYTLIINDEATKSAFSTDHMAWEAGDQIGWFTDKAGSSAVNMATTPRSFTVSSTAALEAGSVIYAYAPYKAGEQSKTAAPLSIPAMQSADDVKDAMPLVAVPVTLDAAMAAATDTPVGSAQFLNLGALIRYNVYTTDDTFAAETVESVTFTAASALVGDFTFDLTAVSGNSLPDIAGLSETAVTSTLASATTVGDSKENGIKLYQVIAPGSYSGTIRVTTNAATYEYNLSSPQSFERSHLRPISLNLAAGSRTVRPEYLLTAHTWKISAFGEYYGEKYPVATGATLYADDTITFNADHTITYNIQNGIFYWDGGTSEGSSYVPTGSERWALEEKGDGLYLTLSGGGIPLMMVSETDAVNGSFKILSLTESLLSVYMVITEWDNYQTYLDFVSATQDYSAQEALLAGKTWKISAFGEYYGEKYPVVTGAALYADDTITFNADHTITYNIQNGIFYWDGGTSEGSSYVPTGSERWALEEKGDGLYLTLSGGGIPLMMVSETDAVNGSFKILSLSEDLFSVYMIITEWDNYQTYLDFIPVAE